MTEQSRINAVISYFFLGPIFLLAKSGTPLAETYVRNHAKKASKIILFSFIVLLIYLFFIRNFLNFSILGITLDTICLIAIIGGCLGFLIRGAYGAYTWMEVHEEKLFNGKYLPNSIEYKVGSEEEKTRILAAMIPFLGIWLSKKYPSTLITHARILGSFFTFLSILSLYFGGSESLIPFLIVGGYILLFVIEGVYLFIQWHFLLIPILIHLPEYSTIEAYIFSGLRSIKEFFRIVFGGNTRILFSDILKEEIEKQKKITPTEIKYFMPIGSVWLPFWNLFTLPSLFIEKYKEYRFLIIQWLLITFIALYILFFTKNPSSPVLFLLIFPIIHIFVFAPINTSTSSPAIGTFTKICIRTLSLLRHSQKKKFLTQK